MFSAETNAKTLLPFLIDIHHTSGRFEKLRQPRRVVADIVDQMIVECRRGIVPLGLQAIEIFAAIRQIELDHAVLARDGIPLLAVVWWFNQRVGIVAQRAFVIGIFELRRLGLRRRCTTADPVVDAVGHQRLIDLAEIAVGASAEHAARGEQTCINIFLPQKIFLLLRLRRIVHRSRVVLSANGATTTAAARIVAGIRLKTIRPVRTAVDADDRKDDHGRWLGVGVDIPPARVHLVGKSDDLAHFSSPCRPVACLLEAVGPAPYLN